MNSINTTLLAAGISLLLGWIYFFVQKKIGEHQALDWADFVKANPQYFLKSQSDKNPARGCPCLYGNPCNPRCTCISGASSVGCAYCCTYGSLEQRTAHAKRLVKFIIKGYEKEK